MGTTNSAGKRLRAKWDAGEAAFGMWAGIPTSFTAELGAVAGYDYVCADLQHGLVDEATMISMFQAIHGTGAVSLARLAWNAPHLIMRALDVGAVGVILPLSTTPPRQPVGSRRAATHRTAGAPTVRSGHSWWSGRDPRTT